MAFAAKDPKLELAELTLPHYKQRNMAMSTPILVTGAAGFIGAYLVNALLKGGTPPNAIWVCDDLDALANNLCTAKWRDLAVNKVSIEALPRQLNHIQPKFIFHLGACSRTDETRWDYLEKVNIEYSQNLWNWCTQNQVPFLYASSAATYGDGELGFDDRMTRDAMNDLRPLNLYGKSKWLFDLWALDKAAHENNPPGYWGFKFFNVYGPGEEHKGSQASVVFHAAKQLREKGAITLFQSHNPNYGDGEQMRDFVCVEDVAKVCLWVFSHQPRSGIYNLGTGKAQTFLDLAGAVKKALGSDAPVGFIPTPEHLREHYQYFTEAKMDSLRAAGYREPFMDLAAGAAFALRP